MRRRATRLHSCIGSLRKQDPFLEIEVNNRNLVFPIEGNSRLECRLVIDQIAKREIKSRNHECINTNKIRILQLVNGFHPQYSY